MARIQDSYSDYLGAETTITAALEIFDELEDQERIHNCYNVLGVIANGMGDQTKALEFYEKAGDYLNNFDSPKKKKLIWTNKNNIASLYMNMEDFEKAMKSYQLLLQDEEFRKEDPKMYIKALSSLAYTISKVERDYEKAERLLNEAKDLSYQLDELYNMARINQFYAEVMAAKGDTSQAIVLAKESREIAKETFNNDRTLDVLNFLANIDGKNAVSYFNDYAQLNETIQEEQRTKRNKFARISWETDQVIEANQILVEEKQAWIGAVMGLLLFGIAALVIVTLYISNSRLKFKQQQQESNQEIYNLMLSQQGKFEEGKQLEQKRISEELHDGILGEMLGIRLILTGLNEREDPASVEQRAQLIEKLRGVEEEIRTISHELNNSSYEKFHNFIVSLEDLIQGIQESSGIACSFSYDHEISWDNLLGDIKINAYRIVQESLKNCVKHANSKHVSIAFQGVDDKLKLTIMDDGVGFDMNRGKKGIGLKNIISRTKKIKGDLNIESKKGKGTTISVIIPAKYIQSDVTLNTKTVNA
jgi:signal transduction histidine kinase